MATFFYIDYLWANLTTNMPTNETTASSTKGADDRDDRAPKIDVAVVTTSGSFPKTGYDRVPVDEAIEEQLARAVKKLEIKDATNWVASVGTRDLNPKLSYRQEGLTGSVDIDYGPREGGGGSE